MDYLKFTIWFIIICSICAFLGSQLRNTDYNYIEVDDYQNQSIF